MQIEQLVAEILNMNISEVTDDTSPQNCGQWTSLKHLILIKKISKNYQLNITIPEIKKLTTVGNIKQFLKEKGVYDK